MNKRQAKQIICSYLIYQLDAAVIGDFLIQKSKDNNKDYMRLLEAAEDIEQEMMRRAGDNAHETES